MGGNRMTPLERAKKLRRDGLLTGPQFLQWLEWDADRQILLETYCLFEPACQITWQRVRQLLKQFPR